MILHDRVLHFRIIEDRGESEVNEFSTTVNIYEFASTESLWWYLHLYDIYNFATKYLRKDTSTTVYDNYGTYRNPNYRIFYTKQV